MTTSGAVSSRNDLASLHPRVALSVSPRPKPTALETIARRP